MNDWMVIKIGGSLLESPNTRATALGAISSAWASGRKIAVVHGGGRRVDTNLTRLGIPKLTHAGLRITHRETLDVVVSTLAGTVNKMLVAELGLAGTPAAGLSGVDGGTLVAEVHPPVDGVDLGFVGTVRSSSPALIRATAEAGFLPVIASVAGSESGALLNVNADTAAAAIAIALGAESLLFLTDVPGVLDDKGRVIERITMDTARQMLLYRVVGGGMLPKLQACVEALSRGVSEVIVAGTAGHQDAIFEGMGGTRLVAA
ncbi:MAG: acetylglutamate kinase [Acidobacteria bacterium]|nr:acetylglutamate kinase [Acidobacteriota bacterium]